MQLHATFFSCIRQVAKDKNFTSDCNLRKTVRHLSRQHSMFTWGFINDLNSFLGFLGLGLGFFFLRFLGLGLNKMELAYVCMY